VFGTGGPFGRLWYSEPNAISNAIGYAKFFSRSCVAAIRVYVQQATIFSCLTPLACCD